MKLIECLESSMDQNQNPDKLRDPGNVRGSQNFVTIMGNVISLQ